MTEEQQQALEKLNKNVEEVFKTIEEIAPILGKTVSEFYIIVSKAIWKVGRNRAAAESKEKERMVQNEFYA